MYIGFLSLQVINIALFLIYRNIIIYLTFYPRCKILAQLVTYKKKYVFCIQQYRTLCVFARRRCLIFSFYKNHCKVRKVK